MLGMGLPREDNDLVTVPSVESTPPARPQIVRTVLLAMGGASVVVGILVVALSACGLSKVSEGILLGHLLAHAVTASWLLGALLTYHLSWRAFMVGTIGAFPLRLLFLGGGVALLVTQFEVHALSLTLSMLGSMVYGFVVEGWTFNTLAKLHEAENHGAS